MTSQKNFYVGGLRVPVQMSHEFAQKFQIRCAKPLYPVTVGLQAVVCQMTGQTNMTPASR